MGLVPSFSPAPRGRHLPSACQNEVPHQNINLIITMIAVIGRCQAAIRRFFGLPCRFPAAPWIRPENRVQGFDYKRLSVRESPKKILSFPSRQGRGNGAPLPLSSLWRCSGHRLGSRDLLLRSAADTGSSSAAWRRSGTGFGRRFARDRCLPPERAVAFRALRLARPSATARGTVSSTGSPFLQPHVLRIWQRAFFTLC